MNTQEFVQLEKVELKRKLMHCCSCHDWADRVISGIHTVDSYKSLSQLMSRCWRNTDEEGYLEAFSAHPKIGDIKVLQDKFATTAHAEQGQVKEAKHSTLYELVLENDQYYKKLGFIFIIFATGKSAEFMLEKLKQRKANSRDVEIKNAAEEQEKIMMLRLSQIITEE